MSPETSSFIASMVSIVIAGYFLFCFISGSLGYTDNQTVIEDHFDLGYIRKQEESEAQPVQQIQVIQPAQQQVSTQKLKFDAMQERIDRLEKKISHLQYSHKPQAQPNKSKQEEEQLNPIYEECIAALTALGHRKSDAKKIVKDYARTNKILDVESFIRNYYNRAK
jgi:hypothetical protein